MTLELFFFLVCVSFVLFFVCLFVCLFACLFCFVLFIFIFYLSLVRVDRDTFKVKFV